MNTIEVVGRMMLALGVVLAVMWFLAKWARKPLTGKTDRVLTVLARQQLSRGSSVAVVKIADRALILGITEQSVALLSETELAGIEEILTISETETPRRRRGAIGAPQTETPRRRRGAIGAPQTVAQISNSDSLVAADWARDPQLANSHRAVVTSRSADKGSASRGRRAAVQTRNIGLDGSILSPRMWKQTMQGVRDLTVRR